MTMYKSSAKKYAKFVQAVRDNPGMSTNELAKTIGVSWKTAERWAAKAYAEPAGEFKPTVKVARATRGSVTETKTLLDERAKTHGDFEDVAYVAQALKNSLYGGGTYDPLPVPREALDMICSKMARICCGNANEPDHWRDIAGYAELVARSLTK